MRATAGKNPKTVSGDEFGTANPAEDPGNDRRTISSVGYVATCFEPTEAISLRNSLRVESSLRDPYHANFDQEHAKSEDGSGFSYGS